MNRALFLDRDGVINEDYGYVHKISDFHFKEGIFDICRLAQRVDMKIIVVTNQAGIGRGYYSTDDFRRLTLYMLNKFIEQQIIITEVYHCPYHPKHGIGHFRRESFHRKPNPGMLLTACLKHDINPRQSLMIGDKDSDKKAAMALGIPVYIDAAKEGWANKAKAVLT